MKKAVLSYIVNTKTGTKVLPLESASLEQIDDFTSQYKNDQELIRDYSRKDKILQFINDNQTYGKIKVIYTTDINTKEIIPPIYDSSSVQLDDNPLYEKTSEIEKARKLLFNSKNQLFAKIMNSSRIFNQTLAYKISMTYQEYLIAKKSHLETEERENQYYVSFKELLTYRYHSRKLGSLRSLYEDMLELWSKNLHAQKKDDLYYYSRQIKLLISEYEEAKKKKISIKSLNTFKNATTKLKKGFVINYHHPFIQFKKKLTKK